MKNFKSLIFMIMITVQASIFADDIQDIKIEVAQEKNIPLHDIIKNQKYSIDQKLAMMKDILKNKQVDINAKDADGRTALNLVTFYQADPAIAQLLIDAGADVNEPDTFNETPLHNAIAKQELIIAAILLKHGANKRFKNDQNRTPLDLAQSPETIKLLGLQD